MGFGRGESAKFAKFLAADWFNKRGGAWNDLERWRAPL